MKIEIEREEDGRCIAEIPQQALARETYRLACYPRIAANRLCPGPRDSPVSP
jgi:hypothetical protein